MAARKNSLSIDFSNFAEYAERLDELNANLEEIFEDAMEQAAETVEWDIMDAMKDANLPALGKYSRGSTEESVIRDAKVSWSGSVAEIPVGFDKTKPGAGGWLITGTPKMRPNYKLEDIFGRNKYAKKIKKQIEEHLQEEIDERLGG